MNVYFARSLRGGKVKDYPALYKGIVQAIKGAGHKPQFELAHNMSVSLRSLMSSEEYIYARDLAWLNMCHAVIAEVSTASTGVGYEIAYACHVRKLPIFCCAEKEANVSAMILGHFHVLRYRGLNDLSGFIESFLFDCERKAEN